MNNRFVLNLALIFLFAACSTIKDVIPIESSKKENVYNSTSYLPMQIGNYWKINEFNFTKIVDTVSINKYLFYKFYSLIGGDAVQIQYLTIDKNNKLIEKYPNDTLVTYTHADFNAALGHKFNTLNNLSVNDYQVTLIKNTNDTLTFEFANTNGSSFFTFNKSYKKGLGFVENWKEVKLGDKIYVY